VLPVTDLTMRATRLRFRTSGEVKVRGKYRKLVVEARPEYCIIRPEGMRTAYTVPWDAIFSTGGKMFAAAERAEKAARKKGK
jgi:hypothetical protein